jgi:hypothetical protein
MKTSNPCIPLQPKAAFINLSLSLCNQVAPNSGMKGFALGLPKLA